MTRLGIIKQYYAEHIEPRPFSMFTQDPKEIEANAEWRERMISWGKDKFTPEGFFEPVASAE